jgi:hypothetical protein
MPNEKHPPTIVAASAGWSVLVATFNERGRTAVNYPIIAWRIAESPAVAPEPVFGPGDMPDLPNGKAQFAFLQPNGAVIHSTGLSTQRYSSSAEWLGALQRDKRDGDAAWGEAKQKARIAREARVAGEAESKQ